jgi:hypothetical protein
MMHPLHLFLLHPMLWVVIRMIQEMTAEMMMKMITTLMKTLRRKRKIILAIVELSITNTSLRMRTVSSAFLFVRYCNTWGAP